MQKKEPTLVSELLVNLDSCWRAFEIFDTVTEMNELPEIPVTETNRYDTEKRPTFETTENEIMAFLGKFYYGDQYFTRCRGILVNKQKYMKWKDPKSHDNNKVLVNLAIFYFFPNNEDDDKYHTSNEVCLTVLYLKKT